MAERWLRRLEAKDACVREALTALPRPIPNPTSEKLLRWRLTAWDELLDAVRSEADWRTQGFVRNLAAVYRADVREDRREAAADLLAFDFAGELGAEERHERIRDLLFLAVRGIETTSGGGRGLPGVGDLSFPHDEDAAYQRVRAALVRLHHEDLRGPGWRRRAEGREIIGTAVSKQPALEEPAVAPEIEVLAEQAAARDEASARLEALREACTGAEREILDAYLELAAEGEEPSWAETARRTGRAPDTARVLISRVRSRM